MKRRILYIFFLFSGFANADCVLQWDGWKLKKGPAIYPSEVVKFDNGSGGLIYLHMPGGVFERACKEIEYDKKSWKFWKKSKGSRENPKCRSILNSRSYQVNSLCTK